MLEYILIILLVIIIFSILYFICISGLFHEVDIKTKKPDFLSSCCFAYKIFRGSYTDVGHLFTEAASIAPNLLQLGIYYDHSAKEDGIGCQCRCAIGSILGTSESPVQEEVKESFVKNGFSVMELPNIDTAVVCTFPYVSFLSIRLAIARVYPALKEYIQSHQLEAYPMIEIYGSDSIHFMAPLDHQADFWPSDLLEEQKEEVALPPQDEDEASESSVSSFEELKVDEIQMEG